jgi:hypothetical protein
MAKQASWLSIILLAGSLAWAAQGLNVRTGLWQMTYTTQDSGAPSMPKEGLDKLTPEQRARLAASQQKNTQQGPQDLDGKNLRDREGPAGGRVSR